MRLTSQFRERRRIPSVTPSTVAAAMPHTATSNVLRSPTVAARRWESRDVYSMRGEKVMS